MFSANESLKPRAPRTPTRGSGEGSETPQRTPTRANKTTPHRSYNVTPNRISSHSRTVFKPPRVPDFVALAREQHQQPSKGHNSFFAYNPEKEPIKAYLRIRPHSASYELESAEPYLEIVDDLEVSITPPEDSNAYRTRNRAPERYKFSKIFTDAVSQQDFFNKTTLPLIHDVLCGENALIFAYGVTNSGKTFSIMGTRQNPGLLPRTLDVIFNSIEDFKSDTQVRPCMHSLVQKYSDPADENRDIFHQNTSTSRAVQQEDVWESDLPANRDHTTIAIDQHYEYGIWVSFAEIYTERIYDLLVQPDRLKKRKALSLKYEYSSGHKYIAGLKEVKVKTIQEAYAILYEGQRNRAEYSTITNHTSSRSHSIFTIRVVRVPIYENDYVIEDPVYATVSKFSIVDLAGSERYRNTLNSGQRLKEAGNINKSLMVLGQCMETLRLNQMKSAIGKKSAMVPYRHSKLTELFKSSFEGDGKAVMVVNVNPFDTGFDENSHVMKFAAVAKDVATWRRVHPKLELCDLSGLSKKRRRNKVYHGVDALMNDDDNDDGMDVDKFLKATGENEEEEDGDDEDDDDEDGDTEDPFVDNLISQLDELRNKWIEAETRCATIETDIRQQVAKETEVELKRMEDIYVSFLKKENDQTDAKIKDLAQNQGDEQGLLKLQEKQNQLSAEMDKLHIHLNVQEATKHSLLEKIAELEKGQQMHKQELSRLNLIIKEKDERIRTLISRPSVSQEPTEAVEQQPNQPKPDQHPLKNIEDDQHLDTRIKSKKQQMFDDFLDLRKKLRRSLFRGQEYSHDADIIMGEIERFQNVTFDLVKETSMGKLMKLITEKKFSNDPYKILDRSKTLLTHYAQLSLPILAPKKTGRESMIVLSVNAGREEELITEMRNAMSTLHDENGKLKQKLKLMQEGHRRLKEAFEKASRRQSNIHDIKTTTATTTAPPSSNTVINSDNEQFVQGENQEELESTTPTSAFADPELDFCSPILGATVSQSNINEDEHSNGEQDGDLTGMLPPSSPLKNKKRRKLRSM
ncbi:kinesin motor domain-containing protein [Parasitella parasitica]|nr:kinesin motor domain-containing protein [Parasitella parasitica]